MHFTVFNRQVHFSICCIKEDDIGYYINKLYISHQFHFDFIHFRKEAD